MGRFSNQSKLLHPTSYNNFYESRKYIAILDTLIFSSPAIDMEQKSSIGEPLLSGDDVQEEDPQSSYFDIETLRYEADEADETLTNLAASMGKWSSLRRSKMQRMNDLENGSSDEDDDFGGPMASAASATASITLRRVGKYFMRTTSKSKKQQKFCSVSFFRWLRVPILRQQWIKCENNSYLNSSLHEERRPRWMDLLFDLVLVGFQLHICKIFALAIQHLSAYHAAGFILSSFGIVALLWQTVQNYRNRYHSSGNQDTVIIVIMICIAIFTIRDLHHCAEHNICHTGKDMDGYCENTWKGISALYILYGALNIWVGTSNTLFRMHNIYEATWFFLCACIWLIFPGIGKTEFRMTYMTTTMCLLIIRPALVGLIQVLRETFQPQNVAYLRERLGLLVIINIAVLVEQSFETECDLEELFGMCHQSHDHRHNQSHLPSHGERHIHDPWPQSNSIQNDSSKISRGAFTGYTSTLGYSTLALAIFMKFMYFNVYDYSEMEEQVSKYSYQPINGARLILVYFLAVCCGLLSVDGKLTLCRLSDSNVKSSPMLTYVAGVVVATAVFSFHHYTNTRRAKKAWTLFNFWSFLVLRFLIIVVAIAQESIAPTAEGEVYHIFTFIASFVLSLLVEHYVLHLPLRYGAKRDRELKLILSNLAKSLEE